MIIVYAPEDGEREHYNARKLKVSEGSIAQRTIDKTFSEIRQGIEDEDPEVLRVVAWVMKKRSNPSLRFGEFDPGIEELYTRLDQQEVAGQITAALAVAAQNPDATAADIREALSALPSIAFDPEHAEAAIEEMVKDPKGERVQDQSPADESLSPSLTSPSPGRTISDSSLTSATSAPETSTT